jgi:uncharacterized membrane protein required for colicin V production
MVTLTFFFYFLATMFAVIGAMRGWSRELLVTFSVVVAIFIINVVERYLPAVSAFVQTGGVGQFWFRAIIIIVLVFFGYQTPNITRIAGNRFVRERFQDSLLGLFLGALNGYLIVGTLWFFMDQAGYPFPDISGPTGTEQGQAALRLLEIMPPTWLDPPIIYFAVALAFLFVIVVFI